MDDQIGSQKQDLRQTHFSQNNDASFIKFGPQSTLKVEQQNRKCNSKECNAFIFKEEGQNCQLTQQQSNSFVLLQENPQMKELFSQISTKQIEPVISDPCREFEYQVNNQSKQSQQAQESESSERLSFIKNLQNRLESIQQKIALSSPASSSLCFSKTSFMDPYVSKLDEEYLNLQTKKDSIEQCPIEIIEQRKGVSHCFEEDDDLHRTFQELSVDQEGSENSTHTIQTVKILKTESKVKANVLPYDQKSNTNSSAFARNEVDQTPLNAPTTLLGDSVLSNQDDSNASFHQRKLYVNEKGSTFFEHIGSNDETVIERLLSGGSKMRSGFKYAEPQDLEVRLIESEHQNIELKEKLEAQEESIRALTDENMELWQQKQIVEKKFEEVEGQNYYLKQHVEIMGQDFLKELKKRQRDLKMHYEHVIEQLEHQQSEYSERIIQFEQLFEDKRQNECRLMQELEKRDQHVLVLEEELNSRESEIVEIYNCRRSIEEMARSKEKQLNAMIDELDRKNIQLENIIEQRSSDHSGVQNSYLSEEALDLKGALEQMECMHEQQLQSLEDRYENLISRYQTELERMKSELGLVKVNKSMSILDNFTPSIIKRNGQKETEGEILEEKDLKSNILDFSSSVESSLSTNSEQKLSNMTKQELRSIIQKQSQQKNILRSKLEQIENAIQIYIKSLSKSEQELQENSALLEKCTEQLQRQYQLNKKLKQKLEKNQPTDSKTVQNANPSEIVKIKKANKKMRRYISVLERQIEQFSILEDSNAKFRGYQETIKELKKLVHIQIK